MTEDSGDLTEFGFRERPFEKVEPFVKCTDEVKEQIIAEEKEKAAKIRQELYGDKPEPPRMEEPGQREKAAPGPTAEAPGPSSPSRGESRNVRRHLRMDVKNLGRILASRFESKDLEFSDVEQEVISEGVAEIFELNDEKFKDIGKTMSALEIGGIMLNKAVIINRQMEAKKRVGQ